MNRGQVLATASAIFFRYATNRWLGPVPDKCESTTSSMPIMSHKLGWENKSWSGDDQSTSSFSPHISRVVTPFIENFQNPCHIQFGEGRALVPQLGKLSAPVSSGSRRQDRE
ncbi:hypothetical protein BC828DRAFT_259396 [Blastocladiella britannica]|nr:hypothetical protein BC828DRAFT_259396 [Blastocladiella britannica]